MFEYKDFEYFDMHTHFFPKKIFDAVWKYFDSYYWPVYLKDTAANLTHKLISDYKVRHFSVLNYAHKPGIAHSMNEWTRDFCSSSHLQGIAVPFGTIHAGDKKKALEMDLIFGEFGFAGIKLQLMVTDFHIWDQRMRPVYDKIMEYDTFLFVHIGTYPQPPREKFQFPYLGAIHLERFMGEYPEMKVIVPHLGADEYEPMWRLTKKYPNLYFDTAAIAVRDNTVLDDKMDRIHNEQIYEISDRILFGSDFPDIFWEYRNSILGWLEREMDYSFYEKMFYKNAAGLFSTYI